MSSLSIISFAFNSAGYVFGGQQNDGYIYRSGQTYIGIQSSEGEVPKEFKLHQNYPNPFNPVTKIKFDIPSLPPFTKGGSGGFVTLKVYDILGREAAALVNEQLNPGTYEVEFDGSDYSSGVYYYKFVTNNYTETRKMILIK